MTSHPAVTPRYLLSCALSLLGNSVASVVLPLVLLATTDDALAAGTLALICAVPQMVIGLVGGALIDRLNRRDVSIASDALSALSVALLPVVDMTVGLSFGWFVALGLLGAVGDIPGMTARDALLPAVCEHDKRSLQKFMGLSQSLDSLTVIVGPALAAGLLVLTDSVNALWFTAAMSCGAALVTLTLPRSIGHVGAQAAPNAQPATNEANARTSNAAPLNAAETATPLAAQISAESIGERADNALPASATEPSHANEPAPSQPKRPTPTTRGLVSDALAALHDGVRVLFKGDAILRASMLLSFGITMIMGSFQGLVLPVHFTFANMPEALGIVLSAVSVGMLVSSLAYSALAERLSRRAWFVLSLVGMAAGVAVLGTLAGLPVLLAGALLLGLSAGPASALLGFFVFDRIPAENRGAALGTQNSLMLVAAPVAVFATSAIVETTGEATAALILVACWIAVTLWALATPSLRKLES